jgi:hypothetical protein
VSLIESLPDAEKPHFRVIIRVLLGLVLVAMLPVCWENGRPMYATTHTVVLCAVLGLAYGGLVAFNDIAAGLDEQDVIVRNPLMVVRVPFTLIESVDLAGAVQLRIRGRRTRLFVSGASGATRARRAEPRQFADEVRARVAAAGAGSGDAVRMRFKKTWLAAVPIAIVVFVGVGLLSAAVT